MVYRCINHYKRVDKLYTKITNTRKIVIRKIVVGIFKYCVYLSFEQNKINLTTIENRSQLKLNYFCNTDNKLNKFKTYLTDDNVQ